MQKRLYTIWRQIGSIRLTVALCLLLCADLGAGYLFLKHSAPIFAPLGQVGLVKWFATYGRHNLQATAWFFLLLLLLAALGANTFACTTERVIRMVRSTGRGPGLKLAFRLAPHAMHYALILMLAGYLVSYLASQVVASCVLVPGLEVRPPGTGLKIRLVAWQPEYYRDGPMAAFQGRVIRPRATLDVSRAGRRQRAVLEATGPVHFAGYGIFLKNYGPKQKGGMSSRVFLELSIRRDPGLLLYFAGMALFAAGLGIYLYERILAKETRGATKVCKPA